MSYRQGSRTNPYADQELSASGRQPHSAVPEPYGPASHPYANHSQGEERLPTDRYGDVQQEERYGGPSTQGYGGSAPGLYDGAPGDNRHGGAVTQAYGSTTIPPSAPPLSTNDFLTRVEAVRKDMDYLSECISQIAALHQRAIASPDSSSSSALENQVSQTQILNTRIKDQIKFLETDAARSGGNTTKLTQARSLKNQFRNRLEQYQQEEMTYKKRYQEQIARQYRIVNPIADEQEVREAVEADWGDEGVFQAALKSNRTGAATTVLGSVRARHNDIQQIERTIVELNQLFQDLAETVQVQMPMVQEAERQTEGVYKDTENVNKQLGKGIENARRARKLKWCCCLLVLIILIAIAVFLIVFFKFIKPNQDKEKNNPPAGQASASAPAPKQSGG